jgi:hypothetical protein
MFSVAVLSTDAIMYDSASFARCLITHFFAVADCYEEEGGGLVLLVEEVLGPLFTLDTKVLFSFSNSVI